MTKLNNKDQLIADRIYSIRQHLGLSQSEMASLIEVRYQYISAMETGKRKPGFKTLQKLIALCIANGLAVDTNYLRPDFY
jgi:transcriptional regulator with XRE-family HTH domain